jgi:hypothetical protein
MGERRQKGRKPHKDWHRSPIPWAQAIQSWPDTGSP